MSAIDGDFIQEYGHSSCKFAAGFVMPPRLTLITASTTLLLVAGGVTSIPVRQAQAEDSCDPNYADVCVPIASDVDCAGGSGNGPEYVQGPLRVVGTDIYDLDRDGDGFACDRQ